MFTGITEELGKVRQISSNSITVTAHKVLEGTVVGDSIAVNGVCLTVISLGKDYLSTGIMPETIRRSNLGSLQVGDEVNLERALSFGGRMGGHLVQGHVDGTGKVSNIRQEKEAVIMRFSAPPEVMHYIVIRGFIAIDGVSLTVIDRDEKSFVVSLVEHTQLNTTLNKRKPGDAVNLENDIIAKYVEALAKAPSGVITADFLMEHGFSVK